MPGWWDAFDRVQRELAKLGVRKPVRTSGQRRKRKPVRAKPRAKKPPKPPAQLATVEWEPGALEAARTAPVEVPHLPAGVTARAATPPQLPRWLQLERAAEFA